MRHTLAQLFGALSFLTACSGSPNGSNSDGGLGDAGRDAAPFDANLGDGAIGVGELRANEISILFPLTAQAESELWAASTPARGGVLLPVESYRAVVADLNTPTELGGLRAGTTDEVYAKLRLVSLRYDPCFVHNWGGVTCQPQLRAVFQPLRNEGTMSTFDAAVHLMYNLSEADNVQVQNGLRALRPLGRENAGITTLQVNPTLSAWGIGGPYGSALKALLLAFAGQENLARVTAVGRTNARQGNWIFAGRNFLSFPETTGAVGALDISGINATRQSTTNQLAVDGNVNFVVTPLFEDPAAHIGRDSSGWASLLKTGPELTGLRTWMTRITNPSQTTADNTDCASCHLVGHIRNAYQAHVDETFEPAQGRQIYGAENSRDNMRSFGYFNADPVIAQRVVEETNLVLEFLSNQE